MDDDLVHLGMWQDFSGGKYKGWNLTTTNQQATILTAFIAIGVTAVGTRSWKIYRFLLYQSRRHDLARDAMIREQEVILRNSESALCTLTNVWSLIWAWRSFGRLLPGDKLRKSHRSSALLLLIFLVHWVVFLFLAASLPSLLSKGQPNPVVLLNSNSCVPYYAEQQEMSRFWSIESTQVSLINFATRYYDSCYNDDSMVDCNRLEHRRIFWNETREGCPFPENACLANTEAIGFDTGHLNLDLFSLNRPDAHDLTLRRRTSCAPINVTLFQTEPRWSPKGFRYYNFSADPLEHTSILSGGPLDVKIGRNPYRKDYEVVTVTRMGDRRWNDPSVKAAFNRSDADMTAVIIDKEDVKYPSPVDDAVFGAHRLVHKLDARVRNFEGVEPAAMLPLKWYAADDPVSIIGCADQAEVCHTPDSVCTGLIPLPNELGWSFDAWKNAGLPFAHWPDGVGIDVETFILGLLRGSGFKDIVSKRGSDILSIKKYGLGYERQSDIPPDQWEREARVWFGTSIAKIQVSVMIKALGSLSKKRRAVYAGGNYTGESSGHRNKGRDRDLYYHQLRFRSSQHTTFSMLGLCCCLAMGSFFWLISLLDGLWMRRLFIYRPHRVLAWELDSAMQLIRQLHEHLQSGIWTTSGIHSVPLAFGTLGIATLDSNGTQYIPAYKIPRLGCNDDLLFTVTTISRSEKIRIISPALPTICCICSRLFGAKGPSEQDATEHCETPPACTQAMRCGIQIDSHHFFGDDSSPRLIMDNDCHLDAQCHPALVSLIQQLTYALSGVIFPLRSSTIPLPWVDA